MSLIDAGDKIEFIEVGEGKFEVVAVTREVNTLKGLFKGKKAVSIEDMNNAIEKSASA